MTKAKKRIQICLSLLCFLSNLMCLRSSVLAIDLTHRFWLLSFLDLSLPQLTPSQPTPPPGGTVILGLKSGHTHTREHTCTSSCQLAHCNRRLTRINYSSLTCDIHTCRTLTLTHAHSHAHTHTYIHWLASPQST